MVKFGELWSKLWGGCCLGLRLGLLGVTNTWGSWETIGRAGKSLQPASSVLGALLELFMGRITSPHLGELLLGAEAGPKGWG